LDLTALPAKRLDESPVRVPVDVSTLVQVMDRNLPVNGAQ
jgi:hypothetical protein